MCKLFALDMMVEHGHNSVLTAMIPTGAHYVQEEKDFVS